MVLTNPTSNSCHNRQAIRKFALLLVVLPTFASAAENAATPALTAAALVQRYEGAFALPAPDPELGKALAQHYAKGYLAGVADQLEGDTWCDTGKILAGERDAEVVAYLKKLPATRLERKAAPLIREALQQKYPCHIKR